MKSSIILLVKKKKEEPKVVIKVETSKGQKAITQAFGTLYHTLNYGCY